MRRSPVENTMKTLLQWIFLCVILLSVIRSETPAHDRGEFAPDVQKMYETYRELLGKGRADEALGALKKGLDAAQKRHGDDSLQAARFYREMGSLLGGMSDNAGSLKYHTAALEIRQKLLGDTHPETGTDHSNVGLAKYRTGHMQGAVNHYMEALRIYGEHPSVPPRARAIVHYNAARAFDALGKHQDSRKHLEKALAAIEKTTESDPLAVVLYTSLGSSQRNLGNYTRAIDLYRRALDLHKSSGSRDRRSEAEIYTGLGLSYYHTGDLEKSLDAYNRALLFYSNAYGKDNVHCAGIYLPIGDIWRTRGRYRHAREFYEKALSIYENSYGKGNQYTAAVYIGMGELFRAQGDAERAVRYNRMALDIYTESLGSAHQHTATAYVYLGGAYKSGGEYGKAVSSYLKALDIYRSTLGEDHTYVATVYTNLGGAYEPAGKYEVAVDYYRRAIPIYLQNLGSMHPYTATAHNNLGLALFRLKHYKKAIKSYRTALGIYRKMLGDSHPHVAISYGNMGMAYFSLSRHDLALKNYNLARNILEKSTNLHELIVVNSNIARLHEKTGNLTPAADALVRTIDHILRFRMQRAGGKTGFTSRYIDIFNRLIDLSLRQGNINRAFAVDSVKKGLSIAEGLSLRDALKRGGVKQSEIRRITVLRDGIDLARAKYSVQLGRGGPGARKTMSRILELQRDWEALNIELLARYPGYAALVRPGIPSVGDIAGTLGPREMLVSYSITESGINAFIIGHKGTVGHVALSDSGEKTRDIETMVRNLHAILKNPPEDRYFKKVRGNNGALILIEDKNESGVYEVRGNQFFRRDESPGTDALLSPNSSNAKRMVVAGTLQGTLKPGEAEKYRTELSRKLYRLLLGPVLKLMPSNVKTIITVPDGTLNYCTFGILMEPSGRLAMESRTFMVVHSPIVWYSLHRRGVAAGHYPILAVGNAVYSEGHADNIPAAKRSVRRVFRRGSSLRKLRVRESKSPLHLMEMPMENLPGTATEIDGILSVAYGSARKKQEHMLSGIEANEDMVFRLKNNRKLNSYRAIHFAVHGLFLDGMPELNALVLSRPSEVAKLKTERYRHYLSTYGPLRRDGYLRLGEIKTLNLDCDLVVMSACESSLGYIAPGEGMVALPQAFLLGGARTVIASMWAVDDRATSLLMQLMYGNYFKKRMQPAEALRQAQLKLKQRFSDPYYWGAFTVYGK